MDPSREVQHLRGLVDACSMAPLRACVEICVDLRVSFGGDDTPFELEAIAMAM
jgi:hypothetical protein